jgi:hypothetical protein
MITFQELNPIQRKAIGEYLARTGVVVTTDVLKNIVNSQRIYGKIVGVNFQIYNRQRLVGTLTPAGMVWL